MNNKGMTLVELLITFSLLMVIIVGMFNLIMDAKLDLDDQQIAKDVIEYSNFLNNDIHYDLLKKKPFAIALRENNLVPWKCIYNNDYISSENCAIGDSAWNINTSITIEGEDVAVTGSTNADICKSFYPCAIYAYYNSEAENKVSFKAISVNFDDTTNYVQGVRFGNAYEVIPDQKYIDTSRTGVEMRLDSQFFIIDFPIYIIGSDNNYGFKIAYPINEQ